MLETPAGRSSWIRSHRKIESHKPRVSFQAQRYVWEEKEPKKKQEGNIKKSCTDTQKQEYSLKETPKDWTV